MGIDKTQKSGHLFTILLRGSNAISQLISCSSASMSEKTLVQPFISRKPTLPVWVLTVLLKSFHRHAMSLQGTASTEHIQMRYQAATHLYSSTSGPQLSQLPRKSEGRQWNINFREGKKARKKLAFWLPALLYKARKKGDNTTQDLERDKRID